MKNINWIVRVKNKQFWLTIIPAILLFAQAVAALFGYELEVSGFTAKLIDVINSAFTVLVITGIIIDPTTEGITDSAQAMTYSTPKKKVLITARRK